MKNRNIAFIAIAHLIWFTVYADSTEPRLQSILLGKEVTDTIKIDQNMVSGVPGHERVSATNSRIIILRRSLSKSATSDGKEQLLISYLDARMDNTPAPWSGKGFNISLPLGGSSTVVNDRGEKVEPNVSTWVLGDALHLGFADQSATGCGEAGKSLSIPECAAVSGFGVWFNGALQLADRGSAPGNPISIEVMSSFGLLKGTLSATMSGYSLQLHGSTPKVISGGKVDAEGVTQSNFVGESSVRTTITATREAVLPPVDNTQSNH